MEQFEQLNKVEISGIVDRCRSSVVHNKRHTCFNVASPRLDIDEEGNRAIEITWLQCCTFYAPEGLSDGARVKVSGRLHNQKVVDAEGKAHYETEILAQSVEIL